MKVLLVAYECSPYRGSEWGVGWGRLLQAARVAEVHAITAEANLAELECAGAKGLLPGNVRVHAPRVDARLEQRLLRRPVRRGGSDYDYRAYREWHRRALELARELHAEHGFDVAHQATVCTFREPGEMWRLGVPMVWGPFGGTQNFPWRMLPVLPARDAAYEAARAVANRMVLRLNPRVRAAAAHADAVMGASSTNAGDAARAFGRPVEQLLETALDDVPAPVRGRFEARIEARRRGDAMPPLHLLWSGQMRPRKALPVLLRALARIRGEVKFRLSVLGDGPEMERWRGEAHDLHLGGEVRFRGRLPLPEAVAAMQGADVFCFTSLRDTSGNVVLEALAAGVPVVAFDHQGAADMVGPTCGVRVPVTRPGEAVRAWAEAIRGLAADPERLLRLSEGATVQARQFSWQSNGDRVNAVYHQLARRSAVWSRTGLRAAAAVQRTV